MTLGESAPLITHPVSECARCWGCVRRCPVGAIHLVDGRPEAVADRCVSCGACVGACSAGGHAVRDDLPAVRELLRSRRPVVVLLATEFAAALHPVTPGEVEYALRTLGFWSVETTLLGEEIVAAEYEKLHAREGSLVSIRSTCPVAVDFVRKYYPELVPALAPIVPPYVAQTRLIREAYAADAAIVYVSPCYARKDDFRNPEYGGVVDGVLDFLELKTLLREGFEGKAPRGVPPGPPVKRPQVLKQVSLSDGFPRHTLVSRDLTDRSVAVVRGLDDIDLLLRALVAGETCPSIIDMLNCQACIDGPAVSPGMSGFARRAIDAEAHSGRHVSRVSTRSLLAVLPPVETVRSFAPAPPSRTAPSAEEIDRILSDGRMTRETASDCGACGFRTCVDHAAAILAGASSWELCLPLQRTIADGHRAEREVYRAEMTAHRAALASMQTLDETTHLWNRRVYAQRLDVEVARHLRYRSALSLMMLSVDESPDETGRLVADDEVVLEMVAGHLAGSLRKTDLAARWADHRFTVILPGIGKTAAFAVAEKLREAVKVSPCTITSAGYTRDVHVTVSSGVATASPAAFSVRDLHMAAEAALTQAVEAGGDRVHLASG